MTEFTSYNPTWPKTVIFWGAGATRNLGMRTTTCLSESLHKLFSLDYKDDLYERVREVFGANDESVHKGLVDLFYILEHDDADERSVSLFMKCAPMLSHSEANWRIRELRQTYDIRLLGDLLMMCPGASRNNFKLIDLFNLIDLHISQRQGFYVNAKNGSPPYFVDVYQLDSARNALKMLVLLFQTLDYQKSLCEKRHIFDQYRGLVDKLRDLMVEEAHEKYNESGKKITERSFYLHSFSVISMNWDPLLLWLMFCSNKDYNDHGLRPHFGDKHPAPLKMFHDLGHFMGVRKVDGDTPDVWYPFNETVVQRVNDDEHVSDKRVRIGKFYFPHGCTGWRECPNCGKLTMYLGNEWDMFSKSLFPPHLLPTLSKGFKTRSKEEQLAQTKGLFDAYQCAYCGTLMGVKDTPIVMQSNVKGKHPSFIEEIQRDMRVSLEGAEHIVLMGYSLPEDDVIYRSLLAARKGRHSETGSHCKCSIVGYDAENLTGDWVCEGKLTSLQSRLGVETDLRKTIDAAIDIFGEDNVRVYSGGVPGVFLNEAGIVDEEKVRQLLNYKVN